MTNSATTAPVDEWLSEPEPRQLLPPDVSSHHRAARVGDSRDLRRARGYPRA